MFRKRHPRTSIRQMTGSVTSAQRVTNVSASNAISTVVPSTRSHVHHLDAMVCSFINVAIPVNGVSSAYALFVSIYAPHRAIAYGCPHPGCGKRFSTKSNMDRHRIRMHGRHGTGASNVAEAGSSAASMEAGPSTGWSSHVTRET